MRTTKNNDELDRWAIECEKRHLSYGQLQALETCHKLKLEQTKREKQHERERRLNGK